MCMTKEYLSSVKIKIPVLLIRVIRLVSHNQYITLKKKRQSI